MQADLGFRCPYMPKYKLFAWPGQYNILIFITVAALSAVWRPYKAPSPAPPPPPPAPPPPPPPHTPTPPSSRTSSYCSFVYDKRDDFDFDIVNFPFLDGDVPRRTSYGVNISQLIRVARASSNLNDYNYRNKALTAKLLRQGYRYFKLRKAFSKFYRRHSALLEKYSVSLKTLLQQGISEPEFYGDLVYRFRKIVGKSNFSEQFRNLLTVVKELAIAWILCGRLHA